MRVKSAAVDVMRDPSIVTLPCTCIELSLAVLRKSSRREKLRARELQIRCILNGFQEFQKRVLKNDTTTSLLKKTPKATSIINMSHQLGPSSLGRRRCAASCCHGGPGSDGIEPNRVPACAPPPSPSRTTAGQGDRTGLLL